MNRTPSVWDGFRIGLITITVYITWLAFTMSIKTYKHVGIKGHTHVKLLSNKIYTQGIIELNCCYILNKIQNLYEFEDLFFSGWIYAVNSWAAFIWWPLSYLRVLLKLCHMIRHRYMITNFTDFYFKMFKVNKPSSSWNKQLVKIKLHEIRKYLRFLCGIKLLEWTRSKPGRFMSRISSNLCTFLISIKHYVHTSWWVFDLKVESTCNWLFKHESWMQFDFLYWNHITFSFNVSCMIHYLLYVRKLYFSVTIVVRIRTNI